MKYLSLILLLPLSATAQVYKCTDANGTTTYSGTPCPNAETLDINSRSSTDPQRLLDEAAARARSQQYTDSQMRAASQLKRQGESMPQPATVVNQAPPRISQSDNMRLEEIKRQIKNREFTDINVDQARREIKELQTERRAIYAKYGIQIDPPKRQISDAKWRVMELEERNQRLENESRRIEIELQNRRMFGQ